AGHEWEQKLRQNWSLSPRKIMQRTRDEHDRLLSEFTSLPAGIANTLGSTGEHISRLLDAQLFLFIKRALDPSDPTASAYRRNDALGPYESVRSRLTNVSIESESDDYLKVGGFLYTFITIKEPPDSTYPGLLRELLSLDFPMVVNTEILIPDQTKV